VSRQDLLLRDYPGNATAADSIRITLILGYPAHKPFLPLLNGGTEAPSKSILPFPACSASLHL
jgi:hypothetical protein